MTEGMRGAEMFLVRIGDDEREECVDALTEHHLRGRLSAEEFDRRQRAALEALTAADLGRLVADLPSSAGELLQRAPRTSTRGRFDARTAALWAAPPVVIVSSAAVTSTVIADAAGMASTPGVFWVSALTGAVGYATHWAVLRFRSR
ncbi:MAG TPA: DUF1707 domain-containing protein [Actinomycetes bacterium]|nr:DUF1707 domain-containing protein [Actinomycetes bacterium]